MLFWDDIRLATVQRRLMENVVSGGGYIFCDGGEFGRWDECSLMVNYFGEVFFVRAMMWI